MTTIILGYFCNTMLNNLFICFWTLVVGFWIFEDFDIWNITHKTTSTISCQFMCLLCFIVNCLYLKYVGLNLGNETFNCVILVVGCSFLNIFSKTIDMFVPKKLNLFGKFKNHLIYVKTTQVLRYQILVHVLSNRCRLYGWIIHYTLHFKYNV
jgi:hypothetical protein